MTEKTAVTVFETLLREKIVIFDGGMGTSLLEAGLTALDFTGHANVNEILCVTRPDVVEAVHRSFLEAGADVIETNTFCASPLSLREQGLEARAREINLQGARLARRAADDFPGTRLVAGSIGPTSLLPTLDHIDFKQLAAGYEVQITALIEGGCDLLVFETCQDSLQIKAAAAAARTAMRATGRLLPVIAQFTVDDKGRTLLGSEPEVMLCLLEALPVSAVGLNCGVGPAGMFEAVRSLSLNSSRPISCQPNAGFPEIIDGQTVFTLPPAEFAEKLAFLAREAGLNIAGGCCGTRPEHIAALAGKLADISPRTPARHYPAAISSLSRVVELDARPKPLLVAEEMNATTRKKSFRKIVEGHDEDKLLETARKLEDQGAQLLDLCVATVEGDEAEDMAWALQHLRKTVAAPLFIDTTDPQVIEAAGQALPGRFVVNSVNLENGPEHLRRSLEAVANYGAAVIAMTLDEDGIAADRERKMAVAGRLYSLAVETGVIAPRDLIFDPLTLPLGTGSRDLAGSAVETLEALRLLKQTYPQCLTVLGVSNISFGLSRSARRVLNSVFLWEAVKAGLDIAIISRKKLLRPDLIDAETRKLALDLIYNRTANGTDPLLAFSRLFTLGKKEGADSRETADTAAPASPEEALEQAVLTGTAGSLEDDLARCLKHHRPEAVLNDILLAAMTRVGELFEEGKLQLPSVLASAEIIKKSFTYLQGQYGAGTETGTGLRGTLVLATVKGDVHDIGKNLVDMVLTSSGYAVINLGIKQTARQIMEEVGRTRADAVGLSGLLTRSVMEMEQVLREFRREGIRLPFILGGAALRRGHVESKLREIYRGPVFYAGDAMDGLKIMHALTDLEGREAALEAGSIPVKSPESGTVLPDKPVMKSSPGCAEGAVASAAVPEPPFFGRRIVESVPIAEIVQHLDTRHLFKFHWKTDPADRQAAESLEAMVRQAEEFGLLAGTAVYGYYRCRSRDSRILVFDEAGAPPSAELTFPPPGDARRLSLPRLILTEAAAGEAGYDVLPVFVVTVGGRAAPFLDELKGGGQYGDYLRWHGFFAQAAEALAAALHARLAAELSLETLPAPLRWRRFSFGYPACPDLANQASLFDLLQPEAAIGVSLSETFQMIPEHSVSAFLLRVEES